MKSLPLLTSVFVASAPSADMSAAIAVQTTAEVVAQVPDILPAAQSRFTIAVNAGQEISIKSLLDEYEHDTGMHLVINSELVEELSRKTTGYTQTLDIAAVEVHSTVEQSLLQAGYRLTLLHAREPVLLGVVPATGPRSKADAVCVPFSELASVANHPALMVSTVVHLEHAAAIELATELRSRWKEQDFQNVLPFRSAHAILLIGTGSDVAARAAATRELDETVGRERAERAQDSTTNSSTSSESTKGVKK